MSIGIPLLPTVGALRHGERNVVKATFLKCAEPTTYDTRKNFFEKYPEVVSREKVAKNGGKESEFWKNRKAGDKFGVKKRTQKRFIRIFK